MLYAVSQGRLILGMQETITVKIAIAAPMAQVWNCWTAPEHIAQWNNPSADWHTIKVTNEVKTGGRFLFAMRAKDGSDSFDFEGAYDEVILFEKMSYTLNDGRKTTNLFSAVAIGTEIIETFEPNAELDTAMQRDFCAGVLQNFKAYVEGLNE